jgi:hypothetical protein
MAKTQQEDFLTRFRDLSAEALNRLSEVPGGSRLMEMANETRTRLDEMQKKLRGLDELEKRVAKLEKQVASLGSTKSTAARKPAASRPASPAGSSAARKPATPKKPPA